MNKEFNSEQSADTNAEQRNNDETTKVSQPCSNTPVGCSSLSLVNEFGIIDTTPNYLKERYDIKRPFPFAPWM
jgi:hypothetical protein